jgi:dTDP-4-dehydrorhamnose reductase
MSGVKSIGSPSQLGLAGMQKPWVTPSRIVLLGGRGMLGSALSHELRAQGVQPAVFDLPEFDVRRESDLADAVKNARVVINCAAYTNVDGAEREPEMAQAVNAHAVGVIGRLAATHQAMVLHISTDFVFDGTGEEPCSEQDEPRPLSVYGASKLAGERSLAASGCEHLVVRLQWTYGAGGANFITKCIKRGRVSRELRVVSDQIGSPTWTRDAAVALIDLLGTGQTGLFHYAARGFAGRSEVAAFAFDRLGVDCRVVPCPTDEVPTPARRPLNSRFNCGKVDQVLSRSRPTWQDSLREFLDSMREGAD